MKSIYKVDCIITASTSMIVVAESEEEAKGIADDTLSGMDLTDIEESGELDLNDSVATEAKEDITKNPEDAVNWEELNEEEQELLIKNGGGLRDALKNIS